MCKCTQAAKCKDACYFELNMFQQKTFEVRKMWKTRKVNSLGASLLSKSCFKCMQNKWKPATMFLWTRVLTLLPIQLLRSCEKWPKYSNYVWFMNATFHTEKPLLKSIYNVWLVWVFKSLKKIILSSPNSYFFHNNQVQIKYV